MLPVKTPVFDLELRAEHVLDAEVAGERVHLVAGGRGDDRHGVALVLVRIHEGAGFRVDGRGQVLLVHLLADLLEDGLGEAAVGRGRGGQEAGEPDASQREAEGTEEALPELAGRHPPGDEPLAEEGRCGEAGEKRLVEIEERPDLGAGRASRDLAGEVAVEGHGCPSMPEVMGWGGAVPSRDGRPRRTPRCLHRSAAGGRPRRSPWRASTGSSGALPERPIGSS